MGRSDGGDDDTRGELELVTAGVKELGLKAAAAAGDENGLR